jgi:hypothetical protein
MCGMAERDHAHRPTIRAGSASGLATRGRAPMGVLVRGAGRQVAGFSWFAFAVTFAATSHLAILSRAPPAQIG